MHCWGVSKPGVISSAPPLPGDGAIYPPGRNVPGALQSQPPAVVTAFHMWRSERAGGCPDVVYFPWSSVTSVPHCWEKGAGSEIHCPSLSVGGPLPFFWILPKDRAGVRAGPGPPQAPCLRAEAVVSFCPSHPPESPAGQL
jgi:hypothetical protein